MRYTVVRTWRATDSCGNSMTCSQTIGFRDTLAPAIVCGTDQTLECGTTWSFSRPSAFDICDGTNVAIRIVNTVTNALCGRTFSATRTWSASDSCGNSNTCSQTIILVDTIPPLVNCAPNRTVECGTPWTFTPPSGYDLCDGTNIAVTILSTTTNHVGFCASTFAASRAWRITDQCGNGSICTQTVTIVDTTPPEILCGPTKTNGCGIPPTFDTPVAFDLCDGTLVPVIVNTVSNLLVPSGSGYMLTRTWTATDSCSNMASCSQSIMVTSCLPAIVVQIDVACVQPGYTSGPFAEQAMGYKSGTNLPAFWYRVVVSNSSSITLTNVMVIDDHLGNLTTNFFPSALTPFPPHTSLTNYFIRDWPANTTNIVVASGQSVVDGTPTMSSDGTLVTIGTASINCLAIAYSPDDQDNNPYDSHVTLPDDGLSHVVAFYMVVCNGADADLANVQIATPGLSALGCFDMPATTLAARACRTNTLCIASLSCSNAPITLTSSITSQVDGFHGACSVDIFGRPIIVRPDAQCSIDIECGPAAGGACRVTGGGRQNTTYPVVDFMTHGGQVGAPVSREGFDPDSECIHGNWEVVRHEHGGTKGNFHAKSFDSMMCACLTCAQSNGQGGIVGGLCNPNDTNCGPGPRKAPANKITFSGVGDFTLTSGSRVPRSVIFRVDIEDRGEPGNSGKARNDPPDRHRIRIWILTDSELIRLNNPSDRLLDMRKAISATEANTVLQDGAVTAAGVAVPNGTQVFGIRPPDIDDGGVMDTGNHQIHPAIKTCF
jgi:hypothetical protein